MVTDITPTREEIIARALDAHLPELHRETEIFLRRGVRLHDIAWLATPAGASVQRLSELFVNVEQHVPAHLDEAEVRDKIRKLPRSEPGAMLVIYSGPEGVFAQHPER